MPVIEFKKLVTVPLWIANKWCVLPYHNHPKGCPNHPKCKFSKRKHVEAEYLFDLDAPKYIVYASFDLKAHAKMMKQKLPKWTDRQCRCLLYWQRQVDNRVSKLAYAFVEKSGLRGYHMLAEGYGVNVYATAWLAGLKLERIRHINTVRKLVLLLKIKEV